MKQKTQKLFMAPLLWLAAFVFCRCTFDYGDAVSEDDDQADIVMGNVEYVRMRDGDPVVRFRAQQAERYENRQTMELQNFSFEQFYDHGGEINATGSAGSGMVELESGNIQLERSIIISVESEDITIETDKLSWEDTKRILAGSDEHRVDIQRSDGTVFSGKGFSADARSRTWAFTGGVEGSYVDTEEEEAEEEERGETEVPLDEESFPELAGELPSPDEANSDAAQDDL
ncbi:MAG: LPS export ABC transporter periplasmic protein LptC [Treponema sp.]|jgi:LPS export ABC transporter protein LptC|nr:LPS export ABC transporter periplasmic protein LptC [Treponema sp.]